MYGSSSSVGNLRTQLENYKLIAEVNSESLDISAILSLSSKLTRAQRHLDELEHWEAMGDKVNYHDSLIKANQVLGEISTIIHDLINFDVSSPDGLRIYDLDIS